MRKIVKNIFPPYLQHLILVVLLKILETIKTRSKSTHDQNPPSQTREPLTDQGLGVTMIVKNK